MSRVLPASPGPRIRTGRAPSHPIPPDDWDGGRGSGGDGPNGHGPGGAPAPAATPVTTGVWLLAGAIAILFVSFTSTLLVRRAEADWTGMAVPPLLWLNTVALAASSAALEWARAHAGRASVAAVRSALAAATALGAAFLAGQWVAWRQLIAAGVHLASGAHASFFYLLTGAHALHVAAGVAALLYVTMRARWAAEGSDAWAAAAPAAIYWHFVGGLWVYVFVVLFWL